jgi:biotin carboxylase
MAHLLIIEFPGGNDFDIAHAALERGDTFSFLTSDLKHYLAQPEGASLLAQARQRIEVPGFDPEEVMHSVLEAHAEAPIDGVLSLLDIRIVMAARIAHRLSLRHLGRAEAAILRDKYSVRCQLREKGIVQPDFALAESNEALAQAVAQMGLPVLIKPSDGYASQNIAVLRYPEDLDPILSPLQDMLPSRADYGLGVSANDRLLVERYMEGVVIGCDTLSFGGKHTLLGIHEKLFFEQPSFAIRGSCFSNAHPQWDAINMYVQDLLNAAGFHDGATHIELMLSAVGPRLIEINPRLVGAKIARLVNFALNRSVHQDLIAIHTGQYRAPVEAATRAVYAVTRWLVSDESGFLDGVVLAKRNDPRIRCAEVMKRAGDYVRPPLENADRIAYVMVCADSREAAESLADSYIASCKITLGEMAPSLSLVD